MGYLIDTHIFLWFVSGDKKLPKTLKQKMLITRTLTEIIDKLSNKKFYYICMIYDIKRIYLNHKSTI